MNFNNPPAESPQNVFHKTFYSQLINHEIGYNIYLPPDYDTAEKRYPVTYHLHGWRGNESSDIWVLEKIYRSRPAITVFVNATSGDNGYLSVTAYAGTYHHFYHEASGTVGAAPEKASMLLESMMKEKHHAA